MPRGTIANQPAGSDEELGEHTLAAPLCGSDDSFARQNAQQGGNEEFVSAGQPHAERRCWRPARPAQSGGVEFPNCGQAHA